MTATATTTATTTTSPADAATAMRRLRDALRSAFVQRDVESLLLCVALIAEEHVLLLGDPGTAKTKIATVFVHALGITRDEVYEYLLGKTTQPDELFGAMDMVAYKQGTVRTVTNGKLPEAKVAVLDEIFKCNSAILNNMLTILNERQYDNPDAPSDAEWLSDKCVAEGWITRDEADAKLASMGGTKVGPSRKQVPLQIAVGMSNELPEGGPHGYLGALYDRFLFRRWVEGIDISTDAGKAGLRGLLVGGGAPRVAVRVTEEQVATLRAARRAVDLEQVADTVIEIKEELAEQGLKISDRRLVKCMGAIQAHAALHGRTTATLADVSILEHCLWDETEERALVRSVVVGKADQNTAAALEQQDIGLEAFATVPDDKTPDDEFSPPALKAGRTINEAIRECRALEQTEAVVEVIETLQGYSHQIERAQKRRMGIDD